MRGESLGQGIRDGRGGYAGRVEAGVERLQDGGGGGLDWGVQFTVQIRV